jgi:hypothetical protein
MTINIIPLTDSAAQFSFCSYPVKGTAFISNDQIYLEKNLAASLLFSGSFRKLAPFVETYSDLYLINGVECLPDSFLFFMFVTGRRELLAGVSEKLYDHSFQEALASFMTPVN